jgi:phage shock protein PspC (stress-responsive transcriptional regulator)
MEKKLYRDEHRKVIGGVCAGLADYLNIDVSIVRIIFLASLVLKGVGFLPYIILWIVLPKKNYIFNDPTVDYKVPPDPMGYYDPANPLPVKKKSNFSVIAGASLIVTGTFFLLDELNFIPDIDFGQLWPVILIGIGFAFIFQRDKPEPWKEDNWTKAEKKGEEPPADKPKDDNLNDNPPTVQL